MRTMRLIVIDPDGKDELVFPKRLVDKYMCAARSVMMFRMDCSGGLAARATALQADERRFESSPEHHLAEEMTSCAFSIDKT